MQAVRFVVMAVLVLASSLPAALAAGRVALVVGNSAYTVIGPLPNPGNDATDVAAALDRLGFDVTTVRDADRGGMSEALRVFTRESAAADTSLVFYAGHGLEMDGVNYLVPVDAQLERDTNVRFEAVELDDAGRAVRAAHAGGHPDMAGGARKCRDRVPRRHPRRRAASGRHPATGGSRRDSEGTDVLPGTAAGVAARRTANARPEPWRCEGWRDEEFVQMMTVADVTDCLGAWDLTLMVDSFPYWSVDRFLRHNPVVLDALAEAVLAAETDATARYEGRGATLLHRAAAGRPDIAAIDGLLAAGADPRARDDLDRTPLHYAARNDPGLAIGRIAGHISNEEPWTCLHR